MDLEFLHTLDVQILGAVAVAVVAIVIGAVFLFSSKEPKGLSFSFLFFLILCFFILCFCAC
jgi:predicted membrane-bound mannosyltransferase